MIMSQRHSESLLCGGGNRNHMWRRASLLSVATSAALLGMTGIASADDASWNVPSGAWETGTNWSTGNVPGSGDFAWLDNGGAATLSTFTGNVLGFQIGSATGKSGSLVQTGGALDITSPMIIGNSSNGTMSAGGTGTYTMNGGALTINDAFVGEFGTGTFILNSGTVTSAGHFRMGRNEGGDGTVIMNGGVLTATGFFLVAEFSPAGSPFISKGHFILNNGTMSCANYNIGQHPNAQGEVHQSGGWARGINIVIGEISRQANLYDLSGGVMRVENTGSSGTVFCGSSNGVGELRVSGTGDARIDGHIFAGSGTNSLGTFGMSGGTVALGLNKPGGGFLVAGEFGTATVNISGGVFSSDFAQFGRRFNTTSRGQATQTGGTATVRRSITIGGLSPNNNFYNISGGTLNVTNDLSQGTLNDTQSGIHVARFSVDPLSETPVTSYSSASLTISGTANVNIAGGLYNSTGFHRTGNGTSTTDADLPGGRGLIQMQGGNLSAGSFLNGGAANAGSFNNGGASAAYVQSGGIASVGPVTGTGTVGVSAGTMTVASIQQAGVTVSGGRVQVTPNGTDTGASRVGSLTLSGGTFDLNDNDLIVTNGTYAAIASAIASARNNGNWNGAGLSSTTARNNGQHNTTLGVLTGAEYAAVNSGTFDSFAVAPTDVLVKYTYYGDTDFNGKVNFDDYVRTDAGFNNHRTGWVNGDFDLNGQVNFDDYVLIDLAFNTQSGTLGRALSFLDGSDRSHSGMNDPALRKVLDHFDEFGSGYAGHFLMAVPEPTALLWGGVVSLMTLTTRRRRTR
jgi:hypothetical protein